MAAVQLTQQQKDALTKAGIDWMKLIQLLGQYAGPIIQAILAIIGALSPPAPAPTPTPGGAKAATLKGKQVACPSPSDGMGCCQCCLQNIMLAGLCCSGYTADGTGCDTQACCQETLAYLLAAVECCASHCNC